MTSQPLVGPVVVGVDGSTANLGALRYAAARARRLGTFLMLVHVVPDHVPFVPMRPIDPEELNQLGASVLTVSEVRAREIDPGLEIEGWLHHGTRAVELAGAARTAEVLVVGRDDRSLVERLMHGDTATGVAARATVPVVEVPPGWQAPVKPGNATVVAGVKAIDQAGPLLGDAFAEASRLGARLRVLHAWRLPSGYDDIIESRVAVEEWKQQVRAELEPQLDPWRERYPEVDVELRIVHGYPGQALVHAAEDADLVVIARRAHGFPAAMHLGATARAVLRSATCPVRVVPPTPVDPADDAIDGQPVVGVMDRA